MNNIQTGSKTAFHMNHIVFIVFQYIFRLHIGKLPILCLCRSILRLQE